MSRYGLFLDSFGSDASELMGRALTYDAVKARVLEAGRFSVFEATADPRRRAGIYDRLRKDPELETEPAEYPWITVRRRTK